MVQSKQLPNMDNWQERVDLAAAFRWTVRLNMHEAVANHFSLAINEDGTKFLMNPNQMHFSRVKASDLLVVDANDPASMEGPDAPDPKKKVMIMGNHGILIIGNTVAETFNRMFYFERACQTYLLALQTGKPLRLIEDAIAEKTAQEIEIYPEQDARHLAELKAVLDEEGSNYSS